MNRLAILLVALWCGLAYSEQPGAMPGSAGLDPTGTATVDRLGSAGTASGETLEVVRHVRQSVDGYRLDDPTLRVLRTGSGGSLQTWSLTLGPPPGVTATRLEFTVGFASAEFLEPAAFLDAFSVSLQGTVPSATALLLTADAPGIVWRPPLPGGLSLEPAALAGEETDWDLPLDQTPGEHFAYRVTLELPRPFQREGFTLLADLFDNGDPRVSLGYVEDVVLRTDPFFLVESSASPRGPFAVETTALHDAVKRTFTLARPDVARFFRLKADSVAVISIHPPTSATWRFSYVFPGSTPVLESAAAPGGPFQVEAAAVLDAPGRMFRLPASAVGRFFRLRGAVRTDLLAPRIRAGEVELPFDFHPHVFSLQSSAQPCGPFADEETALFDLNSQAIELARPEIVRFFRLANSDRGKRPVIRELRVEPGTWVVRYEFEPVNP